MREVQLNPTLAACTAWLVGLGLVLVYSSSSVYAGRIYHDPQRYLRAQACFAVVGLGAMAMASRLPRAWLVARAGLLWTLGVVACIAVLVPGVGHFVGGARRWLSFGGASCQPSEFCKLAVVVWLAALLARRGAAEGSRRGLLLPVMFVQAPVVLILCEPDLGTAVVLELVMVLLLFAAGLRPRTLVVLGLAALPMLYHLVVGTPFRLRRLLSYIDPWAYRATTGYQVTEALISIGSGGLLGTGLGEGKQKLFFLPEAHTDFIFAVLAEELGFVGVLALMGGYLLLVITALRLSARANDAFDRYLALGIAALLGVPALFHACVVTGLLPTKGLPLPFVSYGGSHLVVALIGVGLLFRIDMDGQRDRPALQSSGGGERRDKEAA